MQGDLRGGMRGGAPIVQVLLQMLQQSGGLEGLMRDMQRKGFGAQAQSWVSTGQNQAIPPDALSQIFGQGRLQEIAQQLGMSQAEAEGTLAQALPQVVDRMTPDGSIPAGSDDLVARTLEELRHGRLP
jgi:uncharacterized protein YidB (DUF937 family)